MAKFVLVYKGGSVPESPEQQEAVMNAWMGWFATLGASVVDGGNPFGPSKSISSDGKITDNRSPALTGYSVIDATDLDDAASKAKGCPILDAGGTIDVYETIDM